MNNSDYINESVLLSYFSGELSPEHRKEVKEWIHLSEENEKTARDVYQLYRRVDALNNTKEISISKFEKIHIGIKQFCQFVRGP